MLGPLVFVLAMRAGAVQFAALIAPYEWRIVAELRGTAPVDSAVFGTVGCNERSELHRATEDDGAPCPWHPTRA
ncbi:hypothetical protein DF3PB_890002 [uncultured Defluviicoccus sp.]|uniref:Uncharacterized protein n=1 Tax=metagenome TaxID=256318 RepID=A0A380TK05_9ZZZZ|nr:hypothetical protein DF3PB_890002 [uncultured Defluviicoccus sp.]